MKFTILFLIVGTSLAFELSHHEIFESYARNFNLTFDSYEDLLQRRENFVLKFRKIQAHNRLYNAGEKSFKMGVTKNFHYTKEEAAKYLMGLKPEMSEFDGRNERKSRNWMRRGINLPESFSWVDKNAVTPVQDQGKCGSCYAFSAIAALESHAFIKFGKTIKLSEQEAMECTRGCKGGHPDLVFIYSRIARGCASEDAYPYLGDVENYCFSLRNRSRVEHSRSMKFTHIKGGEEEMMEALVEDGPLSVGMAVYINFLDYTAGVYDDHGTNEEIVGYHAVLIVGYGEENGKKFWLAKNSWTEGWGEQGYFKILRGKDFCEIESMTVSYPVLEEN